jgi:hypothetical protein
LGKSWRYPNSTRSEDIHISPMLIYERKASGMAV